MMPQSMTKGDNVSGVVYDSMGGKPALQGHEDTGVASDVNIEWNYGVADTQKESRSSGRRVMHGMVAYIQDIRANGATQSAPVLTTTAEDAKRVKEHWAPAFHAHANA
jgi:hypothetical protein